MGEDVAAAGLTHADRALERARLHRELDRLHDLVASDSLARNRSRLGVEVEFHLVDDEGRAVMENESVLAAIASAPGGHDFQTELARYNIELNLDPVPLAHGGLDALVHALDAALRDARDASDGIADLAMIGSLPTLTTEHTHAEVLSRNARYHLLDASVLAARGGPLEVAIDGRDRLELQLGSIAIEAAATSVQLHMDASVDDFATMWNAAQAVAGAQVAVGANSPFVLGADLWHESRIPLFEQVIDTRSPELAAQGVRPRVWFGERWIASVTDLFEENVRYFPPLLPQAEPEDATVDSAPRLAGLRLHNGTVWRWNRPVYAVRDDRAHLRVENRVLPAGPTVTDTIANLALLIGVVTAAVAGLTETGEPIEERHAFADAAGDFRRAARHGLEALLTWPGTDRVRADRLLLDVLLPLADRGLASVGIGQAERTRHLDVVAARAASGRTGATWQRDTFRSIAATCGRDEALASMTTRYLALQHEGAPVHTWPTP